jgi:hypothetical protein
MIRRLGAGLVAATVIGCGHHPETDDPVPLDQIPGPALKAAQDTLPGVRFDAAWRDKRGGVEGFEIRGRTADGKIRDVKVSPAGKVLEID